VYATSENRTDRVTSTADQRDPGDTVVRAVAGEIPVRLVGFIPADGRRDTFARTIPVGAVLRKDPRGNYLSGNRRAPGERNDPR
jgi:hypothetical protein